MLSNVSSYLKILARYSVLFLCLLMFLVIVDGTIELQSAPIVLMGFRFIIYLIVLLTIPYLIKRKAKKADEPLSEKANKKLKLVIGELFLVFAVIEVILYFRGLSL